MVVCGVILGVVDFVLFCCVAGIDWMAGSYAGLVAKLDCVVDMIVWVWFEGAV